MANEIEIYKGDTKTIQVTVKDADGVVLDLTSYTMLMTVKKTASLSDSAAAFQATAVIASPATGVGVFTLTHAQTNITAGTYYYDVQINDGTTSVYTVMSSLFNVLQDITESTS